MRYSNYRPTNWEHLWCTLLSEKADISTVCFLELLNDLRCQGLFSKFMADKVRQAEVDIDEECGLWKACWKSKPSKHICSLAPILPCLELSASFHYLVFVFETCQPFLPVLQHECCSLIRLDGRNMANFNWRHVWLHQGFFSVKGHFSFCIENTRLTCFCHVFGI